MSSSVYTLGKRRYARSVFSAVLVATNTSIFGSAKRYVPVFASPLIIVRPNGAIARATSRSVVPTGNPIFSVPASAPCSTVTFGCGDADPSTNGLGDFAGVVLLVEVEVGEVEGVTAVFVSAIGVRAMGAPIITT